MKMSQITKVIWVKTLEKSDGTGEVIPHFIRDRYRADKNSWPSFLNRAESILQWIEQSKTAFSHRPPFPNTNPTSVLLFCIFTFTFGLSLNLLGPRRDIHILLNPFIGLWLWNFAILPVQILFLWKRKRPLRLINTTLKWRLPSGFKRWIPSGWTRRVLFLKEMAAVAPHVMRLKLSLSLHLGAILILAGAMAGLYARGLLLHYTFSWESTFTTNPDRLQSLFDVFFTPAKMLTGVDIPRLEGMGSQMSGASWIHLFAAASFLYVGIPRMLLLIANTILMRKQKVKLEIARRDPYFISLIKGGSCGVFSYGMKLNEEERNGLIDVLGIKGNLDWVPIQWGDSSPFEEHQHDQKFLLFHAAQTPEEEIQGRFLKSIYGEPIQLILWNGKKGFHQSDTRLTLWEDTFRYAGFESYLVFQEGETYQLKEHTV